MKNALVALCLSAFGLFAQVPTAQPQPATSPYGLNVLTLLPEYTRASFESTFGVQPAAYDTTRPPKTWFDSTKQCNATNPSVTYQSLNQVATDNIQFVPFNLSTCDAGSVNLKGLQHFAPYVLPFTSGNVLGSCNLPGCAPYAIGLGLQSTLAMAQSMLAEIGDSTLSITDTVPSPPGTLFGYSKIDPSNTVSVYMIGQMNVGQYWPARNAKGVGYPGTWTKTATGIYAFTPTVMSDGSLDTRANVAVPVRTLLPNEKFDVQILGIFDSPVIDRTDLAPAAPASGDGFTSADRTALNAILAILNKLTGQQ